MNCSPSGVTVHLVLSRGRSEPDTLTMSEVVQLKDNLPRNERTSKVALMRVCHARLHGEQCSRAGCEARRAIIPKPHKVAFNNRAGQLVDSRTARDSAQSITFDFVAVNPTPSPPSPPSPPPSTPPTTPPAAAHPADRPPTASSTAPLPPCRALSACPSSHPFPQCTSVYIVTLR